MFKLKSDFKPTGDQPQAIQKLTQWIKEGHKHQTLLGVTGSGKTFTMANVIANVQKPTLVLSHNKTLAAQLYQEFREFFPQNAVEYFVSYYDYYQPESYIPQTDTYIEKDAQINDEIDKLRLSATTALMTRKDVIVVSSVSCIYNLGSPAEYSKVALELKVGMKIRLKDLLTRLLQIYYERNEFEFKRGTFRVRGDFVDVFPAYVDFGLRIEIFDDILSSIYFLDPLSGDVMSQDDPRLGEYGHFGAHVNLSQSRVSKSIFIYPAKHYITNEEKRELGIKQIEYDLQERVKELKALGKEIEAYRLEQRTKYDIEMIREIGYCKGIENYSRYFDGRKPGEAPYTLLDFFPKDFLMIIDESHISVPQIRGMYNGDKSRKQTLVDYGFRLPSALDNRPLNFDEFLSRINQVIYTSATPDEWEIEMSQGRVAEQLVRPTGILDPKVSVLPTKGQIKDLICRIEERVNKKERVLVTTLTKRMAEELSSFLLEKKIKVTYLHSDIDTLERTDILDKLRRGEFDVLVGINLLREGLDLPEVSLVAILDADKEGFLRSQTSLIQTMGRAARHVNGEVVMYADTITESMRKALEEVNRRRAAQEEYNKKHGITPKQIVKAIREKIVEESSQEDTLENVLLGSPLSKYKFVLRDNLVKVKDKNIGKGKVSYLDLMQENIEKSLKKKKSKVLDIDYFALPPSVLKKEIKRLEQEMKYQAEMLNFEQAAVIRDLVKKLKSVL